MRDLEEAAERVPAIEVPPAHASVWWNIKEAVCVAEMQILKRLGFNMQVRGSLAFAVLHRCAESLFAYVRWTCRIATLSTTARYLTSLPCRGSFNTAGQS